MLTKCVEMSRVAYGTNYRTACVPRVAAPCRNESQTRFLYEGVPHSVADLHTAQFCIPLPVAACTAKIPFTERRYHFPNARTIVRYELSNAGETPHLLLRACVS